LGLTQPKKGQEKQNHDHEADEIDDRIHAGTSQMTGNVDVGSSFRVIEKE